MAELFDLVAGTSTGSLLATSIVMPNDDTNSTRINKYFAEKAIQVYTEMNSIVFTKFEIPTKNRIIGTIVFIIAGALTGFYIGSKIYTNSHYESNLKKLNVLLRSKMEVLDGTENSSVQDTIATSILNQSGDIEDTETLKNEI